MANLAFNGGSAVRTKPYPAWPRSGDEEKQWLDKVLKSGRWFAGLQGDDPEALGTLFAKRFADLHAARHALPVSNGSVAIEVALRALDIRHRGPEIISCPTCGRTGIDLFSLAREVEEYIQTMKSPLKVAVMGCVVNGPGEAAAAVTPTPPPMPPMMEPALEPVTTRGSKPCFSSSSMTPM